MSRICVLITSYNSEATLGETLDSLQALDGEMSQVDCVVLSDDGSTDNTIALAKERWTASTPLRVLQASQNRGEYRNVNEAFQTLSTEFEWVLNMHSDNLLKEGWVRELTGQIRNCAADVASISTGWDFLRTDGVLLTAPPRDEPVLRREPGRKSVNHTLKTGCWWHNGSAAIRIRAFLEVGGLPAGSNLRQAGDWDLLLRFLTNGWAIELIPKHLLIYRDAGANVSSRNFRSHRDLTDKASVIAKYSAALSAPERVAVFSRIFADLIRRVFSSLIRMQFRRLLYTFPAAIAVGRSFIKSLKSSRVDRALEIGLI